MKLLHVIGTLAPSYGGPAIACPELCAALARRGHEVELFAIDHELRNGGEDAHADAEGPGYAISRFPTPWPNAYGMAPSMAARLWNAVRYYDVVHVHSLYRFHTAAASAACRRRSVPYIVSPHGSLDRYHWEQKRWKKAPYEYLVDRRILNRASAIHVTTAHEKSFVDRLRLQAPVRVVPFGVTRPIESESPRPGVGLEPRRPTVVFIGRLAAKKRIDLLIDAFALAAESQRDASLVIAGPAEGSIGDELRSQVARLGLVDRVRFAGPKYGAEKWELLAAATVFVLPSEDESFGIAVAEAMAAGVPVIVSRGVALHGPIADAGAGLVVERSVASLRDALVELLAHPDRAAVLGRRGLDLVDREFSWDSVARKMEALLFEVAGRV